jgi:hypothetical protein
MEAFADARDRFLASCDDKQLRAEVRAIDPRPWFFARSNPEWVAKVLAVSWATGRLGSDTDDTRGLRTERGSG